MVKKKPVKRGRIGTLCMMHGYSAEDYCQPCAVIRMFDGMKRADLRRAEKRLKNPEDPAKAREHAGVLAHAANIIAMYSMRSLSVQVRSLAAAITKGVKEHEG